MRIAFKESNNTLRIVEVRDVKFVELTECKKDMTFDMYLYCDKITIELKQLSHYNYEDRIIKEDLMVRGYSDLSARSDVVWYKND